MFYIVFYKTREIYRNEYSHNMNILKRLEILTEILFIDTKKVLSQRIID